MGFCFSVKYVLNSNSNQVLFKVDTARNKVFTFYVLLYANYCYTGLSENQRYSVHNTQYVYVCKNYVELLKYFNFAFSYLCIPLWFKKNVDGIPLEISRSFFDSFTVISTILKI